MKFVDKLEIVFSNVIFKRPAAIIVLNNIYDSIFDDVHPALRIKHSTFLNAEMPEKFVCQKRSDTFIHVHRSELMKGRDEIIGNMFESLERWNILIENSSRAMFSNNEVGCADNGSIVVENIEEGMFNENFFGMQKSITPIHATCLKQNVMFENNKISISAGPIALLKCVYNTSINATITTTTYLHPCHCSSPSKIFSSINTLTDQLYQDQEETALCIIDGYIKEKKIACKGKKNMKENSGLQVPSTSWIIFLICTNIAISFILACFIAFHCYYFVCKRKVDHTKVKIVNVGRKETFEDLFIRTSCDILTNLTGSP